VRRAFLAALFCVATAAGATAAADDPTAIARSVGERFEAACDAGKIDAVMALYQKDARVVYPGEGQSATEPTQLRRIVGDTCKPGGPKLKLVGYRAVWIDAAHTVIGALGDWEASGAGPEGQPMTTKLRATEVIVKTKEGWKYAVDHASFGVPAPAGD
jgi:ketosteroid isomerase-like protein